MFKITKELFNKYIVNISILGIGNATHSFVSLLGDNHSIQIHSSRKEYINGQYLINNKKCLVSDFSNLKYADIVIAPTTPMMYSYYIDKMNKHCKNNVPIVFTPGQGGLSVFIDMYLDNRLKENVISIIPMPFNSRVIKPLSSVDTLVVKKNLLVFSDNSSISPIVTKVLSKFKLTYTSLLRNTPLIPISGVLHFSRLVELSRMDKQKYPKFFYEDMTEETIRIMTMVQEDLAYVSDRETDYNYISLYKLLVEHTYNCSKTYPNLLDFFKTHPAYTGLTLPLTKDGDLDINNRYFTEDITYGVKYLIQQYNNVDPITDCSIYMNNTRILLRELEDNLNHKFNQFQV